MGGPKEAAARSAAALINIVLSGQGCALCSGLAEKAIRATLRCMPVDWTVYPDWGPCPQCFAVRAKFDSSFTIFVCLSKIEAIKTQESPSNGIVLRAGFADFSCAEVCCMAAAEVSCALLCSVSGGLGDLTFAFNIIQVLTSRCPSIVSVQVVVHDQAGGSTKCAKHLTDMVSGLPLAHCTSIVPINSSDSNLNLQFPTQKLVCILGPVSADLAMRVTFSCGGHTVAPHTRVFVREFGMADFHYDLPCTLEGMHVLCSGFAANEAGVFPVHLPRLPHPPLAAEMGNNTSQPSTKASCTVSSVEQASLSLNPPSAFVLCHLRSPKHNIGALRVAVSVAKLRLQTPPDTQFDHTTHLITAAHGAFGSRIARAAKALEMQLAPPRSRETRPVQQRAGALTCPPSQADSFRHRTLQGITSCPALAVCTSTTHHLQAGAGVSF